MFLKSLTAVTLLGLLTEQCLPVAADNLHWVPSYGAMRSNPRSKPASRQLGEVSAVSIDQHESRAWKRAVSNDSDLVLQQEQSWYWGGGKFNRIVILTNRSKD